MKSTCSEMTTQSSTSRDQRVSSSPFLLISFTAQFSVRENLLVVAGSAETKNLTEMMPDILKQVGAKQYQFLKGQLNNLGGKAAVNEDDDDDVPNLVGTFEDAGKK
jgi:hypothetical protein